MLGITDPSEEYFKDGLWAWVADQWKKLVADASNFLQINIAAQDIDIEIKQTAAADLTPGACGWDGSAWHKLPMIFGYSDRLAEEKANTNATAGTVSLSFTAVPVGYVYVVGFIDAYNINTDPSLVQFQIRSASVIARAVSKSSPGVNAVVIYSGTIILKEADFIRVRFEGCAAGDDLYAHIWGYKMKVAE